MDLKDGVPIEKLLRQAGRLVSEERASGASFTFFHCFPLIFTVFQAQRNGPATASSPPALAGAATEPSLGRKQCRSTREPRPGKLIYQAPAFSNDLLTIFYCCADGNPLQMLTVLGQSPESKARPKSPNSPDSSDDDARFCAKQRCILHQK